MKLELGKFKNQIVFTVLVAFIYTLGSTYMVPETDFWTRFYNTLLSFGVFGAAVLIVTRLQRGGGG